MTRLRTRFARAAAAAGATGSSGSSGSSDDAFDRLIERYAEPHRYYHTLEHVQACLAWLDRFSGMAAQAHEVELALWFHDVVYDPRRDDNEHQSALLARTELAALGVSAEAIERIEVHIEATAGHGPADGDTALVIDIDLTILGASVDAFDQFEVNIRQEYAHVPAWPYREGRAAVLEGFLARRDIYQLREFRDELEAPARTNLRRVIRELSGHR